MATIIAAGFGTYAQSQAALARLAEAGVDPEYICEFRVNPPGMHDQTAIGGDHASSEGAHHAGGGATKGVAVGAVVGAVVGAAATPLIGPAGIVAGAGAGAYTGSLIGGMKAGVDHEAQPDTTDVRPAEAMVAVNVDGANLERERIVRLFEECGAWQVEDAQGLWQDGEWADFDPVAPPHVIGGRAPDVGTAPRA
ncbi:MAG TPA: hypothetical protein VFP44_02200 [Usitatibacter sp.]|nr:hypothetical protein [Usitatibacter sp.]